jgi:L-lactate permease
MAVGLIPCIGWLNYINLPLAFVTVIVSIVASSSSKTSADRSAAMIGLAFALIAGFVGFIRLLLGGGCL